MPLLLLSLLNKSCGIYTSVQYKTHHIWQHRLKYDMEQIDYFEI